MLVLSLLQKEVFFSSCASRNCLVIIALSVCIVLVWRKKWTGCYLCIPLWNSSLANTLCEDATSNSFFEISFQTAEFSFGASWQSMCRERWGGSYGTYVIVWLGHVKWGHRPISPPGEMCLSEGLGITFLFLSRTWLKYPISTVLGPRTIRNLECLFNAE